MNPDLLHQIALTLVPNIGPVQARILLEHFGNAKDIFKVPQSSLNRIEGIKNNTASSVKAFNDFARAEEEIAFIEKYKIKTLSIFDANYPQRLLNCYDPPPLLYFKGNADFNVSKIVAIVGTRKHTDYGRQFTETLVEELSAEQVTIISGLAFGIDATAHKAALKNGLSTIGVVGHGLDTIYPAANAGLAKEMIKENGGILTQFTSSTIADKHNFPIRNRIVAGLADASVIIETNIKGGSMITAEMANGYNRDVFAVPGRTTDSKSEGCNYLIKNNKAILLTDAQQLLEIMGWQDKKKIKPRKQKELFVQLSAEEQIVVDILKERETVAIDELNFKSGLSSSTIAAAILNLELQNIIRCLPGKMYTLD